MEKSLSNYLIPENIKGKSSDVEHSIKLDTLEQARSVYRTACERLLNVNAWHELSGFASAHFELKDQDGHESKGMAIVGNYVQIDIPGPGPDAGNGYDWVKVEAIESGEADAAADEESMGMRLKSCKNPLENTSDTAHFFTNDATSTLIIQRENTTVTASHHGRNEVINTDTEKVKDKIRNTIIGAGALVGLSEMQWGRLIKSFLEKES